MPSLRNMGCSLSACCTPSFNRVLACVPRTTTRLHPCSAHPSFYPQPQLRGAHIAIHPTRGEERPGRNPGYPPVFKAQVTKWQGGLGLRGWPCGASHPMGKGQRLPLMWVAGAGPLLTHVSLPPPHHHLGDILSTLPSLFPAPSPASSLSCTSCILERFNPAPHLLTLLFSSLKETRCYLRRMFRSQR